MGVGLCVASGTYPANINPSIPPPPPPRGSFIETFITCTSLKHSLEMRGDEKSIFPFYVSLVCLLEYNVCTSQRFKKRKKEKLILATSLTESCVTFVSEPTRFHWSNVWNTRLLCSLLLGKRAIARLKVDYSSSDIILLFFNSPSLEILRFTGFID